MVKFCDLKYTTSDSEEDPDYVPEKDGECEDCADSYTIIEELNETIFEQNNKIKKIKEQLDKLRKIIINIATEVKSAAE